VSSSGTQSWRWWWQWWKVVRGEVAGDQWRVDRRYAAGGMLAGAISRCFKSAMNGIRHL
jgi:hypothetical protein